MDFLFSLFHTDNLQEEPRGCPRGKTCSFFSIHFLSGQCFFTFDNWEIPRQGLLYFSSKNNGKEIFQFQIFSFTRFNSWISESGFMASLHIISWNWSLALLTRNIVKCSLQIIRPTPGNLFISNFCTIYFNLNAYYLYMPWYGQKSTEVTHQLFCSFYTVLQSI